MEVIKTGTSDRTYTLNLTIPFSRLPKSTFSRDYLELRQVCGPLRNCFSMA